MRPADAEHRQGRLKVGDVVIAAPGDVNIILVVAEIPDPAVTVWGALTVRTAGGSLRRVAPANLLVPLNYDLVDPWSKLR